MDVRGVCAGMLACVVFLLLGVPEVQPAQKSRSYYETLDVEPSATLRQIKKAFHTLAVKYHPDKNKTADAERIFREVAEAYEVLSNKDRRRLYDRLGHDAFQENEGSSSPGPEQEPEFHFVFDDLFMDAFHDDPFSEDDHVHWRFFEGDEDFFDTGDHGYHTHVDDNEDEFFFYF